MREHESERRNPVGGPRNDKLQSDARGPVRTVSDSEVRGGVRLMQADHDKQQPRGKVNGELPKQTNSASTAVALKAVLPEPSLEPTHPHKAPPSTNTAVKIWPAALGAIPAQSSSASGVKIPAGAVRVVNAAVGRRSKRGVVFTARSDVIDGQQRLITGRALVVAGRARLVLRPACAAYAYPPADMSAAQHARINADKPAFGIQLHELMTSASRTEVSSNMHDGANDRHNANRVPHGRCEINLQVQQGHSPQSFSGGATAPLPSSFIRARPQTSLQSEIHTKLPIDTTAAAVADSNTSIASIAADVDSNTSITRTISTKFSTTSESSITAKLAIIRMDTRHHHQQQHHKFLWSHATSGKHSLFTTASAYTYTYDAPAPRVKPTPVDPPRAEGSLWSLSARPESPKNPQLWLPASEQLAEISIASVYGLWSRDTAERSTEKKPERGLAAHGT